MFIENVALYTQSCNTFGCGEFSPNLAIAPIDPPSAGTMRVVDANTLAFTATAGVQNGGGVVTGFKVVLI